MNALNKPQAGDKMPSKSAQTPTENFLQKALAAQDRMSKDEQYRQQVEAWTTTPQDNSKKQS